MTHVVAAAAPLLYPGSSSSPQVQGRRHPWLPSNQVPGKHKSPEAGEVAGRAAARPQVSGRHWHWHWGIERDRGGRLSGHDVILATDREVLDGLVRQWLRRRSF